MLLESETDLTLALGLAAGLLLALSVLLGFLFLRARAALAQANEALSKTELGADRTERRMFSILQAIPVALVETDTAGKFNFANRAAHQLLGRKDAELIGLRFHSATWGITYPDGRLIPPDLLPAARALRGQTVKGFQHLMINPNTRKKMLVSVTAMPILNEAGEVIGSSSAIVETESLSTPQSEPEDELRSRYFDIAGVLLLALGRDGRIRDINPYGAQVLGLTVDEAVGRDWVGEFLPEEDRVEARAFLQDIVEDRREMPAAGEGWIVRPDGARRLISWRGSVLRDARGKVTATLSSGEDVTDRRAAETRAAEVGETLRLATEAGGIASWSVNNATGEVRNSPLMADVWGLKAETREDVDRQLEMIHPEDRARVDEALSAVRDGATGVYHAEFRVVRPDGTVVWLAGHGEPIRGPEGEIQGMRGVNYDISALKSAQAAVQESESRFGDLADVAPVMIWISDPDGARTWVNRPVLEFTGRTLEELAGEGWLDSVHAEDRARVRSEYAAAVAARTPFQMEYRLLRHDGEPRWLRFSGAPRHAPDGAFLGFIGGGADITEAVLAREELERRVAERTHELEAAQEDRRKTEAALAQAQRLETVGRLTGGVAHDFNNLLTVVIGALDMIVRQAENPERVKRLGDAALAASRRGERLTRQLLTFSRRQEFEPRTVELSPVVLGFESMIRRAVAESTPVEVAVAPDLGVATLDPVQLESAILNLVVNARDAVEGGGGITVRADRVRLSQGQIPEAPAGDYARVAVIDTGVGMSPDVAARAFEPFFTTKEVGKGTGLGLAQVYGFAKQSGGGVQIDSAPGQGSTVALYLPLTERPADAPDAAPLRDERPLEKGRTVLLVEDDLGVRTVAENLLLELGCRVIAAEDGPSALAALEGNPEIEVLLSDIVMPGGMNGAALADAASQARPDLKVLLSTGYAGDSLPEGGAGRWPVLRKPYQAEELAQALRRLLA
jgi:PAS domain S-box-containing protein